MQNSVTVLMHVITLYVLYVCMGVVMSGFGKLSRAYQIRATILRQMLEKSRKCGYESGNDEVKDVGAINT